jgi:hypothetical protein
MKSKVGTVLEQQGGGKERDHKKQNVQLTIIIDQDERNKRD